jgi:glycosyltransferase involved in cell wall biosynthesis
MRIGVNTRLLLKGKLEGIGWFTYQTVEKIVKNHPEHDFYFFFDRPYDPQFVFAPNVHPVVVGPQARHPVLFYIWFDWSIGLMLKKYKIDLFLSTDGFMSLTTKVPTCLVIHDLAFEHYPEHFVPAQRFYWRHFIPKFAHKAKRIVTVSSYSKEDICKHYSISPDKVAVVYNGAHDEYKPLLPAEKAAIKAKYADGAEYFFFAGAIHPRKNIVNLLKAFVLFKKRQPTNMKLLIVGRPAWKYQEVEQLKAEMQFKEDVKWVGYMNVDDLSQVTGAAYALVYPSLFEGFGIPILEAMHCDVPGIVSNTSSMPEVAGDAALLVDPQDPQDIAAKMHLLYKDENLRAKLIQNGHAQRTKFDWNRSAVQLWDNMMLCLQ